MLTGQLAPANAKFVSDNNNARTIVDTSANYSLHRTSRHANESQQAHLLFVRYRKNADDEEWVGRPTLEFLGRAEKEMQIGDMLKWPVEIKPVA